MARIDDYSKAAELAWNRLTGRDASELALACGGKLTGDTSGGKSVELDFLGRPVVVSCQEAAVYDKGSGNAVSLQEQVLVLHYLERAKGDVLTGKWISYQEIPDGRFYMDVFKKRAKDPLTRAFGEHPDRLVDLAVSAYGARPFDHGDKSVVFHAFPFVPIALIIWKGDDEFPPDGNILFDGSVVELLSAEDAAWLAGMCVYPLIGKLRG